MKSIIAFKFDNSTLYFIGENKNKYKVESVITNLEDEIEIWNKNFKSYLKTKSIDFELHNKEFDHLCKLMKKHGESLFLKKMIERNREKDYLIHEYRALVKNPIHSLNDKLEDIGFLKLSLEHIENIYEIKLSNKEKITIKKVN